jgi:hypothetical protein
MTPEQERTFRELMKQVADGKLLPCIIGDWAYANGCWPEARDLYYNMALQNMMGQQPNG